MISVSLPRLRKLPEWISGIGVPSRESLFRHIRRVQRKPLPAFVVFQALTVQSNHHTGAAYVGVTGVEFLVSCFAVTDSAPFSTMRWAKLRPLIQRCRRAGVSLQPQGALVW